MSPTRLRIRTSCDSLRDASFIRPAFPEIDTATEEVDWLPDRPARSLQRILEDCVPGSFNPPSREASPDQVTVGNGRRKPEKGVWGGLRRIRVLDRHGRCRRRSPLDAPSNTRWPRGTAADRGDRRGVESLASRLDPEVVLVLADRCIEADYHARRKVNLTLTFDSLRQDLGALINPRVRRRQLKNSEHKH